MLQKCVHYLLDQQCIHYWNLMYKCRLNTIFQLFSFVPYNIHLFLSNFTAIHHYLATGKEPSFKASYNKNYSLKLKHTNEWENI
jgi:hypothetical protein